MLAMVTLQETMMRGIMLIILFALGHCIPVLIGGTATSFVKKITTSGNIQKSGNIFKKSAGVIFIIVAIYIIFK